MPPTEDGRIQEETMMEKKIKEKVPEVKGHRLFMGRFEKTDLGWFLGSIFACCIPKSKAKWGDERDWGKVEGWADEVGEQIKGIVENGR
jgi:hypothetical protein